jgi:hypothetical protein
VPAYVEDELRNYLECGLFCFGFARAVCMTCRTGFVVAFFCKGRGVCPSCNGRHMAQTAAHLVDHVIPPVPVRQWVISVPKRLRGMLADRPRAVAALTRIFLDEIERLLCAAAGVTRAANNPRPERPHHARPLRAAQAQSRHLGRARPRPQVHAPGGQWRHRTHAVCRQDAGPAVQPNLGFGCDRPRRQGPGMALPPECQLNRLADLVPPPRKHRHRYPGGVCAESQAQAGRHGAGGREGTGSCSAGTGACPRLQEKAGKHRETGTGTDCCAAGASPSHDTSRIAWAKLLARVGEEFPLACPNCGGDIRPIAFITDPGPIHATAAGRSRLPSNRRFASGQWPRWHCLREAEPPPVSPARGPPTDSGEFVQVHHDREVLQSSPEELPVIDIHSL